MTGIILIISGALIYTTGLFFYISLKKQPIQNQNIIMLKHPNEVVNTLSLMFENDSELEQYFKNNILILKYDQQNLHDFNTDEVFCDYVKRGYLHHTDNKVVVRIMDQGMELKARIKNIHSDAHPFRRIMRDYYEMG